MNHRTNKKTIGKMIGSGFAIILILTMVVGLTSYWGLTWVMNVQELYQATNKLMENFITA